MRRWIILPATLLIFATLHAQTGLDQVPGATAMGNLQVVDDTDPFVPNTFIGSFRMEVHTYKNGEETMESPMDMRFWSSSDKTMTGFATAKTKGTEMRMMTDLKDKMSYVLMATPDGGKTAMKSPKKKYIYSGAEDDKSKDVDFKATKETKVIDGHTCTKVVGRSADGTWTAWVAQDIQMPFADLARSMGSQGRSGQFRKWDGLKGFPLEMTSESLDGKEKTTIFTKDLLVGPVDESIFSLDGYKIMEIPGMGK